MRDFYRDTGLAQVLVGLLVLYDYNAQEANELSFQTGDTIRYFDGIVYEFTLEQAIAAGVLCEYDYFVYMADLTEEEYEEYRNLTARMGFRTIGPPE